MTLVKERLFNIKHCWQELGQQPKKHQKSDIYRLLWTQIIQQNFTYTLQFLEWKIWKLWCVQIYPSLTIYPKYPI